MRLRSVGNSQCEKSPPPRSAFINAAARSRGCRFLTEDSNPGMAPVTHSRAEEGEAAAAEHSSPNKQRKVMVEKVRRERIHRSIEQLRALLRTPSGGAPRPPRRMEKADILELAVGLLRQRALPRVAPSYSQGFSQCLQETLRHLSLHAALQPAQREEIKRFYVLQRAALHRHMSGEQHRRPGSRKRSSSRSSARCHGSLWRPW